MILSAQTIRRLGIITPFHERETHRGMSYGLGPASYDVRSDCDLSLPPGVMVLGSTIEHFRMPDDVCASVADKSSWARRGLSVFNTYIDPGWCGFLTLELFNKSGRAIFIRKGDPIVQIIFKRLDEPTEIPYRGKYQSQEAGPQPARDD